MKASQPASRPGVPVPLPCELLLRVNAGPLNSRSPPSNSEENGVDSDVDPVGGRLLKLGVDISKALGAKVALMPSYEGCN